MKQFTKKLPETERVKALTELMKAVNDLYKNSLDMDAAGVYRSDRNKERLIKYDDLIDRILDEL